MKNIGIHFRLLIAVFVLIGATTFTLSYVGVNIAREFIQTRFEERISRLAGNLALNSELGILIDDRPMLNRLAANLLTVKDVAGVSIFDSGEAELTSVSKDLPGPIRVVEIPVLLKESEEESWAFELVNSRGEGDNSIGRVRVAYTTRNIERLLTTMGKRFIWLSAGLACLAGLIFYFLSRSMVRPVTQLAQVAKQVARGDLELRVQPGGLPETRDLALAFNSMLDSLKWNRDALEDAYQEIIEQTTLAEMGKFSLMIAHEVKNPLSIIKSSLDVLKGDPAVARNDTVIFYMEDEIRRLNRLIEDFLAFARPGKPCFRRVDVSALLEEIVEKFQLQKAGTAVEIRSAISPELHHANMDPDMFARAITNILKNAFEANGDRGEVRITASDKDEILQVDVEDQGDGIDKDDIDKIFKPFFTTRSKGTGLGLAYAFQVVSAHSGTITARNRSQGGACFHVEIPGNEDRGPVWSRSPDTGRDSAVS